MKTPKEKTRVLGIHDGHNSSVCLIEDGKIIYASQEERFTYVKNEGGRLPNNAIKRVDELFGLSSVSVIAFAGLYMGDYNLSREKIKKSYNESNNLLNIFRHILKKNNFIFNIYKNVINKQRLSAIGEIVQDKGKIKFIDHHLCHASAAYYGLGNYDEKILVITADGDGDGRSSSVYEGYKGDLQEVVSSPAENSLGRLYSYITFLYNMVPYEHEYKIMGLAPYCKDRKKIEECKRGFYKILRFNDDRSLIWTYCGKMQSIQTAGKELKKLFYSYRFDIVGAALQLFTEELLCEWIRRLIRHTRIRKIALSGGVFMNVKSNMLIAKLPEVESVFVFPSCGDESNAIGAAYYEYYRQTGNHPSPIHNFYLGDKLEINESYLSDLPKGIKINKHNDIDEEIASLLSKGEIVARVNGKIEFGARALGNRSILSNPSVDGAVKVINDMIKGRDFWMPFAPSVLYEDLSLYFKVDKSAVDYEYMMFTAESKKEKKAYAKSALHPYDYTGRPQGVKEEYNPEFYKLLKTYKELTGESLLLNTSYNLHGFPMVRDQRQAIDVFLNSGLQYLALGDYLLTKT